MTKRERRSRKQLIEKLHVKLPFCAPGKSSDYSFEPDEAEKLAAKKLDEPKFQLSRLSSAELFEMIQAAGSLEEPPYAGLIGLLSEQMAGQL